MESNNDLIDKFGNYYRIFKPAKRSKFDEIKQLRIHYVALMCFNIRTLKMYAELMRTKQRESKVVATMHRPIFLVWERCGQYSEHREKYEKIKLIYFVIIIFHRFFLRACFFSFPSAKHCNYRCKMQSHIIIGDFFWFLLRSGKTK